MSNKKAELITTEDLEGATEIWATGTDGMTSEEVKTEAEHKADALADALSEDPEAFIVVSLQKNGGNSPMEAVGRYPADKYDMGQLQEHLRKTYGGGDYRIKLYVKGRIKANKLISIAKPLNAEPGKGGSDLGEMTNMMSLMLQQMQQNNREMLAAIQGAQTGGQSRTEMINEMMLMRDLFGQNQPQPAQSLVQQMREMTEMKEVFGEMFGGDKSEDSGFGDLLEKASPLFEAVATGMAAPSQTPPTTPPQPSPEQVAEHRARAAAKTKMESNKKMNIFLNSAIKQMLQAAQLNADPGAVAEQVLDKLPEAAARKYVTAPGAIDKLAKVNQGVTQFREWFIMVGEHIKAQLGEPSLVSAEYEDIENGDVLSGDVLTADAGAGNVGETAPTESQTNEQTDIHSA